MFVQSCAYVCVVVMGITGCDVEVRVDCDEMTVLSIVTAVVHEMFSATCCSITGKVTDCLLS